MTNPNIVEMARMAGLISLDAQMKFLNLENIKSKSIRAVWFKAVKGDYVYTHGLTRKYAWPLTKPECPHIWVKAARSNTSKRHQLYLWCDIQQNLKRDLPEFLSDMVSAQALFQRWLFKAINPKPIILKMIKERELGI